MTRKVLCLMLCVALVLSACIIPSVAEEPSGYVIGDGVLYANDAEEDFVDGISGNPSKISATFEVEEDENGYYVLKPLADNAQQVGLAMDDYLDYGQVLTFDLRSDNGASKSLKMLCFNATRDARVVNVLINGLTPNVWYTYKFETEDAQDFTVYRKLRGEADSAYVELAENNGWEKDSAGIGSFKGIYFGFRTFNGQYADTQYSIDNIMVADKGEMTALEAEFTENGDEVTPVFTTMGDCGIGSTAVAITAAYDADGNRVGEIWANSVNLSAGISKVTAPAVSIPENGRVEAMLWDGEDSMQPIAPVSVKTYGSSAGRVESSSEESVAFSSKANEITVEGNYGANAIVTVKAVGDGDLVYATQFKAKNDGSFKRVLPINYKGNVTVTVSALGEAAQSSDSFGMLDNWADFKTAFLGLDSENAESFFDEYAENFGNLLDGVTIDAATMANIGYVVSIKEYAESITYGEILDEVIKIAKEDLRAINDFTDDVRAARETYKTDEEQAIADMREILKAATFMDFEKTSDVVCRALLESTAEDIGGIWQVYETAKTAQETQEAEKIPEMFGDVAKNQGMKAFFEATIEISGVEYTAQETLGISGDFTEKDYAVMDAAYDVVASEMEDASDYKAVIEAIEKLVSYAGEYEAWIAEIETKTTASEEWESIKQMFDGDFSPVTAELADTYFSNEVKAYKRITDMGYASLVQAKADISTADSKIAFLAELDGAKNNAVKIKTLLEGAKQKGWIAFSVSESEAERMTGWAYNYFSDIAEALAFAKGPDYVEYLIANGNSEDISFGEFSDDSLILREEMTEGEETYYSLSPDNISAAAAPSFPYGAVSYGEKANAAAPNSVIELDVRFVEKGLPLSLVFPPAVGGEDTVVAIGLVPRETGKWYTYKLELGGYTSSDNIYDFLTVSVKERDNENSVYEVLSKKVDIRANPSLNPSDIYGYDYTCRLFWQSSPSKIMVGYTTFRYGGAEWNSEIFNKTKTDIGSVMKTYQQAYIATGGAFENGEGAVVSKLPASGNVTPVFTVKNTGSDCLVDAITVVYDKKGNMIDYKSEARTVKAGDATEILGPSADASLAAGGGRIEALVVDKADRMRPIGAISLGALNSVSDSELSDTTFSTYANTVTVEGKKVANEKLVLSVKDLSGNVLAVTQFDAGDDGAFKTGVAINPERYTSGTQVKVMLSNVNGTEEEIIDMSSDFGAMKNALTDADNEIGERFFRDFAGCFSYIDNTGTKNSALIIDDGNKRLVTFLVNTFRKAKTFENMTGSEIVEKLIEINAEVEKGSVEEFVAAMEGASDAEVKELLTSEETAKFIAFDLTGVSNVDAIAADMPKGPSNIQAIYMDFEDAKNAQKDKESVAVVDFKNIDNANDMKAFFQNHSNVLGTVTYSSEDAAVMYSVYKFMEYDEAAFETAGDEVVVEAIKFVQNCVKEYNEWTDKVNECETATDEWNAIKEVFGTCEFITPRSVDQIKSDVNNSQGLKAVYTRLDDLGYKNKGLEYVEARLDDDLSMIEEKVACIDATNQAANAPNGKTKGYWGRVKEQVVLAESKGWIELKTNPEKYYDDLYGEMLDETYRYFGEIVDAFDNAVPSGKPVGGNSGGTGGGSGGGITSGNGNTLDGKKDNVTIVQDPTDMGSYTPTLNGEDYPVAPFTDIGSDFTWAEESISGLRNYGIVRGDGDGKFRPGDAISREEFLSILLKIFDIETKASEISFTDVKKDEWYYETVATAYEMGIVKGYSDGRFGIGDKITRADMAVMVCRALDIMGKAPAAKEVGFVFTDYLDIPDYAYNSVARLQQMGLVQGDSYRRFNATQNLTRAESAVVLWPIFIQSGDIIQ